MVFIIASGRDMEELETTFFFNLDFNNWFVNHAI